MNDFISFGLPNMRMEAIQSVLEAKRIARSLESTVDALIPIVASEIERDQLEKIRDDAEAAGKYLNKLYKTNAKEAFGPGGDKANA